MRTITEIDADIAKVREEMAVARGRPTEVYARIVGYYRSVRNWNRGKREEYNHRKLFVADEARIESHLPRDGAAVRTDDAARVAAVSAVTATASAGETSGVATGYELFVRKTCPNCPPVKEACTALPLSGELVDVDTDAGRASAEHYGVYSAPTAIFFDEAGNEVGRAHSVRELRTLSCLERQTVPAGALF